MSGDGTGELSPEVVEQLLAKIEVMSEQEASRLLAMTDFRETPVTTGAHEESITPARHERFMREALKAARKAGDAGQPPIGACIAKDGRVITCTHNSVLSQLDITAHAELLSIREACRQLQTPDLTGCELYSTVEPCAMCLAACHYAKISRLICGARLADMDAITKNELKGVFTGLSNGASSSLRVMGDVLRDECSALLEKWADRL